MNRITISTDRTVLSNYLYWLIQKGFTISELCGYTGISPKRLRIIMEESGLPLIQQFNIVPDDFIKESISAYASGVSAKDIKENYGFSIHELRDICDLRGLVSYEELDTTGKLFAQKKAWSMRKSGMKYHEIQKELGLNSKQAVGSLISGYEKHMAKLASQLSGASINPIFAKDLLEKVSEIVQTDPDTVISRIKALLGKD